MNAEELIALQTERSRRFIAEHQHEEPRDLALRAHAESDIPVRACIEQIVCRRKALHKLPSLSTTPFLYEPLALQQCSGESTARYKAGILKGSALADLCGGLGIDTLFLAGSFSKVHYCEIDPVLCGLFAANIHDSADKNSIEVHHGDGIEFLHTLSDSTLDWIYCDPSRRDDVGRRVDLFQCQPPVPRYEPLFLAKANAACIKASPAFDITKATKVFKSLAEIQVISVDGECKELLLLLKQGRMPDRIPISAIVLQSNSTRVRRYTNTTGLAPHKPEETIFADDLDAYLLDPDPAIVKAGLVWSIGKSHGCAPLSALSPYLTSSHPPTGFPGRVFKVEKTLAWKRKDVHDYLTSTGIRNAIIARRDFPIKPEEIRSLFGLEEGSREYLFFTRIASKKPVCIHAHRV
jgi:hypothetical protein